MQIKLNLLYLAKRIYRNLYKFETKKIEEKAQVKYQGVTIDIELNYQTEVKNLLSKMAQSIKC